MIAIFIYELVVNWRAQGTPFSFHVSDVVVLSPADLADTSASLL